MRGGKASFFQCCQLLSAAQAGGIIEWGDPVGERGAGSILSPLHAVELLSAGIPRPGRIKPTPHRAADSAFRAHRPEAGDGPLASQRLADRAGSARDPGSAGSKWISRRSDECDEGVRVMGDRRL